MQLYNSVHIYPETSEYSIQASFQEVLWFPRFHQGDGAPTEDSWQDLFLHGQKFPDWDFLLNWADHSCDRTGLTDVHHHDADKDRVPSPGCYPAFVERKNYEWKRNINLKS